MEPGHRAELPGGPGHLPPLRPPQDHPIGRGQDVWCVRGGRGPWARLGEAPGPPRPSPCSLPPHPTGLAKSRGASSPPRAGESGRASLCVWILLTNRPGLPPPPELNPHVTPPWLPLLSSPLPAWRFRGDSVGPGNWVSLVCSGLDLKTGPSPRRMSGSPPED